MNKFKDSSQSDSSSIFSYSSHIRVVSGGLGFDFLSILLYSLF